jgi:hypothetical protein
MVLCLLNHSNVEWHCFGDEKLRCGVSFRLEPHLLQAKRASCVLYCCAQLLFNASAISCKPQYWQDQATLGVPQQG